MRAWGRGRGVGRNEHRAVTARPKQVICACNTFSNNGDVRRFTHARRNSAVLVTAYKYNKYNKLIRSTWTSVVDFANVWEMFPSFPNVSARSHQHVCSFMLSPSTVVPARAE